MTKQPMSDRKFEEWHEQLKKQLEEGDKLFRCKVNRIFGDTYDFVISELRFPIVD